MGFGLQAQLQLIKRLEDMESRITVLEGGSPGNFVPAAGVAPFDVKGPRSNPNIAYDAKHRGGGAWTVFKDGIEMAKLVGVKLSKDEAMAQVVRLEHGEELSI
jgi:hypothetical protein